MKSVHYPSLNGPSEYKTPVLVLLVGLFAVSVFLGRPAMYN